MDFHSLIKEAESIGQMCLLSRLTIATAESCTGGLIVNCLTSVSGASQWFETGLVTYSNASKVKLLSVRRTTLEAYGAVSAEVAEEMARGVMQTTGAHLTLSITGIAGPTGGSDLKPVGTVYICCIKKGKPPKVTRHLFSGDRQDIRLRSCYVALQEIKECINR